MIKDIIVGDSKISGKGIFANRDFKKNEIIIKWHPKILTKTEFQKLPEAEKHFIYLADGKYLYMQSPEKYMNHSCESNTIAKSFCDVSVRDIKKGEEITADYSSDGLVNFDCKCGSKKCRGLVN